LAPQPKKGAGVEHPLLFYIHSVTRCDRQIGRLVDRLCTLGTLRLAAVIPLPAFETTSQSISVVEEEIKETRRLLHQLIQHARIWTSDEPLRIDLEKRILRCLDSIQIRMSDLSQGKGIEVAKHLGEASLEYRLIRSRYYRGQFFRSMKTLRIKRLEGYQPYDEFVERRLQSAFGFIEGIEARLQNVRTEWHALDELYLTTAVTILTSEIDRQQTRVAQTEEDIKGIQIWGELFLTVFFIPYYFLSVLFHILDCDHKLWCSSSAWSDHFVSAEQIISVVVALACGVIGALRWREASRANANKPSPSSG